MHTTVIDVTHRTGLATQHYGGPVHVPERYRVHHNGDFSGEVTIIHFRLDAAMVETEVARWVGIPYVVLESIVGTRLRDAEVARITDMEPRSYLLQSQPSLTFPAPPDHPTLR